MGVGLVSNGSHSKMNKCARLLLLSFLLVGAGCLDWKSVHASTESKNSASIVGTWIVDVDLGVPGLPNIAGYLTLHQGGTLTETNVSIHNNAAAYDPFVGGTGSDGHGYWKQIGPNRYSFEFQKLLYAGERTESMNLNLSTPILAIGQPIGYARVKGELTLIDANTLEGEDIGQLLNLEREQLNPLFPPLRQSIFARRMTDDS